MENIDEVEQISLATFTTELHDILGLHNIFWLLTKLKFRKSYLPFINLSFSYLRERIFPLKFPKMPWYSSAISHFSNKQLRVWKRTIWTVRIYKPCKYPYNYSSLNLKYFVALFTALTLKINKQQSFSIENDLIGYDC